MPESFSIDGGVLTFTTSPNYEAPGDADSNNVYLVTVEASDGTNTDSLEVTVNVTDVNEPPVFDEETATRTIAENTAADTNIGDRRSPPATRMTGATLTYTLGGRRCRVFRY